jgi:hypothetical protein
MRKRNPVVRDLIQRPPRGAGRHKDRRKRPDRRDEDLGFVPRNIFDKTPTRGFFYENICLRTA